MVLALIGALALAGASRGASAFPSARSHAQTAPIPSTPPVLVGTAKEGSGLAASRGTWFGSPSDYVFQWQRCTPACAPIVGATEDTYALVGADVGATVVATVTASNADGAASADSAASATIVAASAGTPENAAAPTISGTARQGRTLSTSTGSWSGSANTYSYSWLRCDTSGAGCSVIVAATGTTYTLAGSDVGATIRATVTATNASGSSSAVSGQTDVVAAGEAPSNTKSPSISGTARDNSTLRADPGTWSGDTPITFVYQWQRCDSHGGSCQALKDRTGQKYTVRSSDEGHTLRVLVTATNAVGTSAAQSAAVTVEEPRKPTSTSRPTISGSAVLGQLLTASRGGWTGATPIDYSYTWRRCDANGDNCSPIGGADGSTYRLTADDVGHRLRVRVVARNAVGTEDRTSAATPVVQESAPVNTSRPSIGGVVRQGETLTATSGSWSSASSLAFYYQWARCDAGGGDCVPIANAKSSMYLLTSADVGHRLIVQVKAENSRGAAFANSDPTAVVAPAAVAAPTPTSPPVIGGTVRQGTTLTASTGGWSTGTPLTFSYQWARCDAGGRGCAPIANAVRSVYLLTAADVGHRLIVQVRAQNAGGVGYASSQPTAVVQAAAAFIPPSSVPVARVSLPDRLLIDQIRFIPKRIRSRAEPLVARFHVSEVRGGRSVSGALVYAVGVPFNRLSPAGEVTTDAAGWATVTFTVRPTFPLKRGYLVVVLVRARKPGDSVLAGVSTRRFASVRVG